MIEQAFAFTWGSSEHARVRRWLEQLPAEVVRSRPRLCLSYAQTLFMVAPYTTMQRWLQDAERALRATGPAPTNASADRGALPPSGCPKWDNLLGEIAAYRALITGYHLGEGPATLAFCQEALAHLSEENLLARATVAYAQSLASHSFGDIVASIQSSREATALAQAAKDLSSSIAYLCRTAYSLLVCGKLQEVVQVAEQAALLGTTPVGLPHAMVCWSFIYLADVLREWNRLDEALAQALQSVRLSEQTETTVSLYLGYTELMRVYLARHEMDAARSAFQQAEEALAHHMGDEEQEALIVLAQVMHLAEPEGYIRIFVDEGAPMAALLFRLREQQSKQGPTPYVDTVLAVFSQDGTEPQRAGQRMTVQPLLGPLSEREVLHLIVRGDPNQGIAETLVLSIDTVKRHVSNIFSKLGVNNRVQAVARARVLGLLSDEP